MPIPDLALLTQQVLWAAFLVAMVLGALVQRTGFCTMGAVADVVSLGEWTRMRQWALAAGVATLGFAVLSWAGQIELRKTLYFSDRLIWLSALTGGLLFGFGMVLASGCASKALVRVGGGNLKALVVVLVLGIAAFATLKGLTAVWRVASVDRVAAQFDQGANLAVWAAQLTGAPVAIAGAMAGLLVGGSMIVWALAGRGFLTGNNLLAGFGVGASVVAMWWISGHVGFLPEHPETLQEAFLATNSTRSEALSFVAPVAYALDWLMFYSDKSKFLTIGIVSVFGVVAGAAAVSLVQRSFRWEGFGGTDDLAHHLAGAVLMGVGGVTAMGCTIGQGISGISTLGAGSFIALAAMIGGAAAAVRYQIWRMDRTA